MNTKKLFDRLTAYGADMQGINDRFMGDAELYEECFWDLLQEQSVAALGQAIDAKEYDKAFEAAHALKGLSGNLGLTPFYEAVCDLVESLRVQDYRRIGEQYAAVQRQLDHLNALYLGQQPSLTLYTQNEEHAADDAPEPAPPKKAKPRIDRMILITVCLLVLAVALFGALFTGLIRNYRNSTATESASHLTEINHQIRLYVEEKIENDWKIAHSAANGLARSIDDSDDRNIFTYLNVARDIWGVSNIIVYTESGLGIGADSEIAANDLASDTVYKAVTQGEHIAIVQSTITYTLPVETDLRLRGDRIVAISVVQDLESFLDSMNFSSFDGSAYVYLTQPNGIVISKFTHPEAANAFNVMSLIGQYDVSPLTGQSAAGDTMLTSDRPAVYQVDMPGGSRYVVSTPVTTRQDEMRLFYFVPEAVVNQTLNEFSQYVTFLSIAVVIAFACGAVLVFFVVYRARKRQFDKAIVDRERMFDLLVQNTRTAFGLFTVGQAEPTYISSNVECVIGDAYWVIEKTGDGFRMRNSAGMETEALATVNREMRGWQGDRAFRSGYIRNAASAMPSYFAIELYPVDDSRQEFVGIARDVTQTYEREDATKAALAMAERSNAAKSRFLSNMSHDIRTPMNAIVNMTDFAIENAHNPRKLTGYLRTIRESSDHLLRLINDILDMSRIDSGQASIESQPFDLTANLQQVCDIVRPLFEARQQVFLPDFSQLRTTQVLGDQLKVSQIWMNLLSNAGKFTPPKGAIRFTVEETQAISAELATVRFVVEDTGMGISATDMRHIFEPFTRVDDLRVSGIEGTGLGLSICKSYVEAMGGAITCDSEEGSGSTFTVTLTFTKAASAPVKKAVSAARSETDLPFIGKRCLVCEDNHTNQVIAKTMLERLGFHVDVAADGRAGRDRFLSSAPGYYDVIYIDIQMPVMDGYQATVAIRECTHPRAKTVPIIAMTANVFAEDMEKCRIAGMNGHLGKPILVAELVAETDRVLFGDA